MNNIKRYAGVLVFSILFGASMLGRVRPMSLDRQAPDTIQAEIKGEVINPGVYTLKYGATIQDLIQAAGGETQIADLSPFAQMESLENGQVIVVGKTELDGSSPLISINTATEEQLMSLPGVGPAMAKRIIEYRTSQPFQTLEQLKEVKGIGEKKFASLQEFICL